jgi:heterotetrameric sarcosine oxidase gamma subunit
VSAPEISALRPGAPGIALASCPADIVELAAFRERAGGLEGLAAERRIPPATPGGVAAGSGGLTLSVRPGRWLLVTPPAPPGASAKHWQAAAGGRAAVVDLSSALAAYLLRGPAVDEMLARACRLDLAAGAFPVGRAAATIMVQVAAILARLTPGMLLLTPATTAQHLREWLVETSRPFGLAQLPDVTVSELCGASST